MPDKNPLENVEKYLKGILTDIQEQYQKTFDITTIVKQMNEVESRATEIAKQFGAGRESVLGISKGLTDSLTKVTLMGGDLTSIAEIQKAISSDIGKNVVSSKEVVESLFATSQVVGETSATLVKNFKDVGMSAAHIEEEMTKVVDLARQQGVNAQAVSKQVVTNLDALNKYNFQGGVEGLAKMAAQAVSLRVDMKTTLSLAEKMFNPEQAIEMAAAMQRLGVAQGDLLDPLRLMEMGQNDPAELQNQLAEMAKQFVKLGDNGRFEIMPGGKLRLMEIAKELGISYETLTKMAISSKELDDKMSKIKFPENAFSKEQESFIASIAQMGKDGQYKITIDGQEFGMDEAINEFKNSPQKLKDMMNPKSMEDLAKEQLTTLKTIAANLQAGRQIGYATGGSKFGKDMFDLYRASSNVTGAAYRATIGGDTKTQSEVIDKAYDSFTGVITSLTGEGSLEDKVKMAAKKIEDAGLTFSQSIKKAGENIPTTFNEEYKKLVASNNNVIKVLESIYGKITFGETSDKTKGIPNPQTSDQKTKENIDKIAQGGTPTSETGKKMGEPLEFTIKIEHDLKNTPAGLDESKIIEVLKKTIPEQEIKIALDKAMKEYMTSNGLIGKPQ